MSPESVDVNARHLVPLPDPPLYKPSGAYAALTEQLLDMILATVRNGREAFRIL